MLTKSVSILGAENENTVVTIALYIVAMTLVICKIHAVSDPPPDSLPVSIMSGISVN